MMKEDKDWNEKLASDSEAVVKAERSSENHDPKEMQRKSVEKLKVRRGYMCSRAHM